MSDAESDEDPGRELDQLDLVAAALAAGASAEQAGALVGRSDRTVRRWRLETDLERRIALHRRELLGRVSGGLSQAAGEAVAVLAESLTVDDGEGTQLRIALAVLDRALKYHAASELDARVAELEARLADFEDPEEES
ncbi:MAG: hypothetical protein R2699_15635 [Acidimicrobiales bacterium]